jgi:hypothetical protein
MGVLTQNLWNRRNLSIVFFDFLPNPSVESTWPTGIPPAFILPSTLF